MVGGDMDGWLVRYGWLGEIWMVGEGMDGC